MNYPRNVAVLGGNRIPFARAGKAYKNVSNQDMLTAALDGLVARFSLQGELLGDVAAGAVLKHAKDFNLTRESVIGSALDSRTPAIDMQRACATGLDAINFVANKIALGQIEVGIGGGVDSTSDAPIEVSGALRKILHRANAARSTKERLQILASLRPADLKPSAPSAAEVRTGLNMGQHQALSTERWGITREEQDQIAFESHKNLMAAYEHGFFDDLMTGYQGLSRDENLRVSTMEKLGSLKPVFGGPEGTMTAGNSTPLSDGASTVLIASEEWAQEHGHQPLAYIRDIHTRSVDFTAGADLLSAPAYAAPEMLARNGLTLDDMDFVEIHEAFAATVVMILKAWEDEEFGRDELGLDGAFGSVPRDRLNVLGSSLAAGHPFAATGGRIVASLAKMLYEAGPGKFGLISICAAGGQGTVALLESAR